MLVTIHCPHCGGEQEFDAAEAGGEADCPHCGRGVPLWIPKTWHRWRTPLTRKDVAPRKQKATGIQVAAAIVFLIGLLVMIFGLFLVGIIIICLAIVFDGVGKAVEKSLNR